MKIWLEMSRSRGLSRCERGFSTFSLAPVAAVIAIWAFLFGVGVLALAQSLEKLCLRDAQGETLFSAPIQNGAVFAISYTHSVARTPVTDYFTVKEGAIWLEGSVYHDFGAGLPHEPGPGQKLRQEKGRLIMSGYNKKLGSFDLRVGRIAGHELILFSGQGKNLSVDKIVPLDSLVTGGGTINFSISASKKPPKNIK